MSDDNAPVSLSFPLEVEDGWPPVDVEYLPFESQPNGMRLLVAPLFVKELSVGDVIACTVDEESGQVAEWHHVAKSNHSTFWLLGLGDEEALQQGLEGLRLLGCSIVSAEQVGAFAVDVPGSVSMDDVDPLLDAMEELGVPVACPSDRHEE